VSPQDTFICCLLLSPPFVFVALPSHQLNVTSAGVLGLTTALKLAREGYQSVTIVAKHVPSDCHPEYTSIWAGVNWVPYVSKTATSLQAALAFSNKGVGEKGVGRRLRRSWVGR